MFVITMVFLVSMLFSVQSLLFRYAETSLTHPSQNTDAYIVDNLEDVFQSVLESSDDCFTVRENVIVLRNMLSSSIKSGREIRVTGDVSCNSTGGWSPSPELTIQILISSDGGETWTTMELSR